MLKVCRCVCVFVLVYMCQCVVTWEPALHVYYNTHTHTHTHTPARLPVSEQVEQNIRCSLSRWLTPHFRSPSRETNCKIISRDETLKLKTQRQAVAFSSPELPVLPALMLSLHSWYSVCVCVCVCVWDLEDGWEQ